MGARLHRPTGVLAEFVDCVWSWDGNTALEPRERALPSGAVDIVINLREDRLRIFETPESERPLVFPGVMICGAQSGSFVIETPQDASVMGIHFKPGGAFPFLGIAAGDLENAQAPLDALWGPRASELRERILAAIDDDSRFRIIEETLLEMAKRPLVRHRRVVEALRAFDESDLSGVAEVNERTGLSAKRLLSLFRDEVGLSPKAYWRVRRFQAALRQMEDRKVKGADLAHRLGYCDQAHFVREFRSLSGLSPGAYLAHEIVRPNHVPLRGTGTEHFGKNIQDSAR